MRCAVNVYCYLEDNIYPKYYFVMRQEILLLFLVELLLFSATRRDILFNNYLERFKFLFLILIRRICSLVSRRALRIARLFPDHLNSKIQALPDWLTSGAFVKRMSWTRVWWRLRATNQTEGRMSAGVSALSRAYTLKPSPHRLDCARMGDATCGLGRNDG